MTLNSRNVFSRHPRGWKSKMRVLAGLLSFWGLSPWLWMAVFSPYLHVVFPLCVSVQIAFSSKARSHPGFRLTLIMSFPSNYLFRSPISEYCHILRDYGVETSVYEFWGNMIQPVKDNYLTSNMDWILDGVMGSLFTFIGARMECDSTGKWHFGRVPDETRRVEE